MKIALLADVHGNLPALQAVLDDLKDFQPDALVVAGDLTGGPYSNETIQLLCEQHALMIQGNSDMNLIRCILRQAPPEWQTAKQFGLLRWNASHLSTDSFTVLAGLPEQRVVNIPGTVPLRIVHGSPRDPGESIFPRKHPDVLDVALQAIGEPVLVCGHTHQPWYLYRNGKLAVNPGAVAGPLNGETGAQYARLAWQNGGWQVTLRRVDYDLAPLEDAFVNSDLLAEGGPVARGFLLSMKTGQNVTLAFLNFAYELAEQSGYKPCKILPDEILAQAERRFPWEQWGTETGNEIAKASHPA